MTEDISTTALREWRADSKRMAWDLFDFVPDKWQVKVMDAWADPMPKRRIALQACAGPGKSAIMAILGWHFMLTRSDGERHPEALAVSSDGPNLQSGLWKEFAVWREKSPILQRLFEHTTRRIYNRAFPKTWHIDARQFAKTSDDDAKGRTLSGLHARSIAYFIDESGDMPPSVGRAAEQGLANVDCEFGRIITAFNPTSQLGLGYLTVSTQSHLWFPIRITGDPDDPDRSPRIDIEQAREQIALYGRENPWVKAYILGQFPDTALNALLGPDHIAAAEERHLTTDQYENMQKRLGIDPARFGDDATVIFPRQGLAAFHPVVMRGASTHVVAGRVIAAKEKWGSELELIDSTGGYGGGIADACGLAGVPLFEVNFSGYADDPRFFNKRSEIIWRAAEWVKGGGALPKIPGLTREATAPTYWLDKGKLRVTEKEQIKKQLGGHSPDMWDAFCVTFALAEQPTTEGIPGLANALRFAGSRQVKTDYDPWRELDEAR